MRIGVYIDGFNLYYGARGLCGRGTPGWRWIDLRALATDLVAAIYHPAPRGPGFPLSWDWLPSAPPRSRSAPRHRQPFRPTVATTGADPPYAGPRCWDWV